MEKSELKENMAVVNKRYGTRENVVKTDVLMKDSADGWVPAVLYVGEDRFKPGVNQMFCKRETDFLKEFDALPEN